MVDFSFSSQDFCGGFVAGWLPARAVPLAAIARMSAEAISVLIIFGGAYLVLVIS